MSVGGRFSHCLALNDWLSHSVKQTYRSHNLPYRKKTCMFRSILLCAAVALALPSYSQAASSDWPQWRGPHRDGISPETGLLKEWPTNGPPLVWKVTGLGGGYTTPSVV